MQIQVNTDNHIVGHEALTTKVRGVIEGALGRHSSQITRVEVHLSDENGNKQGKDDKKCVLEARMEGRPPVAVTNQASTVDEAVIGAADKLSRMIDHTVERLRDVRS